MRRRRIPLDYLYLFLAFVLLLQVAFGLGTPIARRLTASEQTTALIDRQVDAYSGLSKAVTALLKIDTKTHDQLVEKGVAPDDPTLRNVDFDRQVEIELGQFVGVQLTSLETQRQLEDSDLSATSWAVRGLLAAFGIALWAAALAVLLQRRQSRQQIQLLDQHLNEIKRSIDALHAQIQPRPDAEPMWARALRILMQHVR